MGFTSGITAKPFLNRLLIPFLILILILLSPAIIHASFQDDPDSPGRVATVREPLPLTRINQSVVLDGIPDEPFWQTIEPFPLTGHSPDFSGRPIYPTTIRVAYDDEYLYLSAVCITPPEDLYLTSFRRDHIAASNDYIAIVLDTFNDNGPRPVCEPAHPLQPPRGQ